MNKPTDLKAIETVPLWVNGRKQALEHAHRATSRIPRRVQVIRRVPFCNAADIDAAVQAAKPRFPGWRDTPPLRRARILMRSASCSTRTQDELAQLDHGRSTARRSPMPPGSVQRGSKSSSSRCGIPHLVKGEYSEEVGTGVDCHSVRQPLGVCAGITPFNFPAMVPLWMFPVALACGNTFVLKPSEKVPVGLDAAWPSCSRKRGCPTACSTSCTATRTRSTRCSHTPASRRSRFVGSTPIAKYIYETAREARQARAGARRREKPRGGAARCRFRFRGRRADRRRLRLGGRALHGDLGGRRGGRVPPIRSSRS